MEPGHEDREYMPPGQQLINRAKRLNGARS